MDKKFFNKFANFLHGYSIQYLEENFLSYLYHLLLGIVIVWGVKKNLIQFTKRSSQTMRLTSFIIFSWHSILDNSCNTYLDSDKEYCVENIVFFSLSNNDLLHVQRFTRSLFDTWKLIKTMAKLANDKILFRLFSCLRVWWFILGNKDGKCLANLNY